MATLRVEWVKQGVIRWEDWYVKEKGHRIDTIPGLKEHISFANFDLKKNGCPPIVAENNILEIQDIPTNRIEKATEVLTYHGFKVISGL
jgi:hypothetical protein